MPGTFITFEGIDGCGKSTQLRMLAALLTARAIPHLATREPGGTRIGNQIRQILLSGANTGLVSTAELLLYAADRAQHAREELRPSVEAGLVVLCDRYTDATLAYQGYGRGLSRELIEELNRIATDGLTPDLTLLLDLDVEIAQARVGAGIAERGVADRLDSETREFHERVRAGYLEMAKNNPNRFVLIPAEGSAESVFESVLAVVMPLISLESR